MRDVINKKEEIFLKLVVRELSYSEIAKKMGKSPRTIDGYRDSLFKKLRLKTRTGLIVYSITKFGLGNALKYLRKENYK